MSATVQKHQAPASTNVPLKIRIDPKPKTDQTSKKAIKKNNSTASLKQNGANPSAPKSIQSSPYKCVPIAAKPANQVPLAPIAARPAQPSKQASPNKNKGIKPNQQHQPQQPHSQTQPGVQPNQPRVLFNGSLQSIGSIQSILAAVGSNPQSMKQSQHSLTQQLAKQSNQLQSNNQFYQANLAQKNNQPGPVPAGSLKHQNNSNSPEVPAPQVFTATTTADGQIIFQTLPGNQQQPQQMNPHLHQQLMQQNFMNLIQQQQQQANVAKNPVQQNQQQPFYFGQNQFNQLIHQQNIMQQQQQQQQQQQFMSQPVAASTPTPPQENTPENLLRQKLQQEEQKFHQLQQQLKNKETVDVSKSIAIQPKVEMNQTLPNGQMDMSVDETATDQKVATNILNTSDPGDKRRGRPRLYVKNPLTGKSIKGKRLDGTITLNSVSKASKNIASGSKKLLMKSLNKKNNINANEPGSQTNGLFPSPSTSISSAHSVPPQLNQLPKGSIESGDTENENGTTSSSASSDITTDTTEASSDHNKPTSNNTDEKLPETNQTKVLTHVIEGYLIKESSAPFQPESNKITKVESFTCKQCKTNQREATATKSFCSQACGRRHKKMLKLSRKSLDSSHNKKENNNCKDRANSNSLSPSKNTLLEDTTNNLSASKSKCKSHHKHRHRRHHGSSSSSSSRDKIKKKAKLNSTNNEEVNYNPPAPPIQTFTTNSSPPSTKLTYQPVAPQQYTNTFNSNLLNQSYSSASADQQLPQGDPVEWNCDEVFDFVKCVAGVNVAQVFKMQEVDGSALSLIRDDHLVNTMQIKLGPALKIMSKFNELKNKIN